MDARSGDRTASIRWPSSTTPRLCRDPRFSGLAEADAFASMGLSRRQALWQTLALRDEQGMLFEGDWQNRDEPANPAALPTMPIGQEVMTDYRTAGLSLKTASARAAAAELEKMNIITAAKLSHASRADG